MVTSSSYESDNRVIRYAQSLAKRGDSVEVLALRRSAALPTEEVINGVRVFRIQDRFEKKERTKLSFLLPLLRFFVLTSWWLLRRHRQQPYDLVHVHNIPDFLVFAAWYPKLAGAKIILDIHDIVPELFSSKFGVEKGSFAIRALQLIEKMAASFANHVIIANHLWYDRITVRSVPTEKCSVFINNVDGQIFRPRDRHAPNQKRVILFPGGLQWHQGLDIAIRAFAKVCADLPDVEFHIYGDGIMKPELTALANTLGLTDRVKFFDPISIYEIADVMAHADVGVVPKRADSFGDEAYSTKIMEFMSVGVPVIVANTKIDRFYFDDSVVRFFQSGDDEALAAAMREVLTDDRLRQKLAARGAEHAARNCWETRKNDYFRLVDGLCGCPVCRATASR